MEVEQLGIKVTAVAPEQLRTDFLADGSVRKSRPADASYGETVGRAMTALAGINHNQLGDPDRASRAILEVAKSDNPPVHILLGSDALARAREKMGAVLREMEEWERWTLSTDFAENRN